MQNRHNGHSPGSDEKLKDWLRNAHAEQYYDLFQKEEIAFADIPLLTKEDLSDMGIPLGPARRILAAVESQPSQVTGKSNEEGTQGDNFTQALLTISQQQQNMMRTLQELQRALSEMQQVQIMTTEPAPLSPSQLNLPEESLDRKYWREEGDNRHEVSIRLRSHTLSSLAKQRRLPSKYMRVSNLRLSYLLRSHSRNSS